MSRAEAQRRGDAIRAFRAELGELEREGVLALSEGQRAAVDAHHEGLLSRFAAEFDIDRDSRASRLSLGMKIASFLGALALAAGVFFLFYQFWGFFDETAQVAILAIASLGSFAFTLWLRGRDASGYFTKLAAMIAFACFVLNLVMLGQIFNIAPSDRALLAWAALALLLAYACELRLLLAAGLLCLVAFVSARAGSWGGIYWLHFGERPENFLPAAAAMFLLPQWLPQQRHAGFAATWRIVGMLAFFLPVLVLSHWGRASYLALDPALVEGGYQVLGFAASGAAIWLGARRDQAHVVNTGVAFFVLFLYTKFFDWWWELLPKYLFFLLVGAISVAVLAVLRRLRAERREPAAGEAGASGGGPR